MAAGFGLLALAGGPLHAQGYTLRVDAGFKKQIPLPWVSFGSDAGSMAPEGVFLDASTHPRAYGNVPRLLGKYVRDEKLIPLEEAIRKLTTLPAENLGLSDRGKLASGYFADVVVFDPATIQDHATFEKPHQYSTGVEHVWAVGDIAVDAARRRLPARDTYDPRWPAHLHIDLLPVARGRGAGRLLMQRWLDRLRADGIAGCHLGTLAENTAGIAFFEAMGFRRHGGTPPVPGMRSPTGARHHEQLMVQELT